MISGEPEVDSENPKQEVEAAASSTSEDDPPADDTEGSEAEPTPVPQEEAAKTTGEVAAEPKQEKPEGTPVQEAASAQDSAETDPATSPVSKQAIVEQPSTPAPSADTRRFASHGRRDSRENQEEITDPRMRRPAVYEPRSGPTHSLFNPRQPVTEVDVSTINCKNVTVLTRFIDNQGRILSRRKSRVDAKTQRRIKRAIKQARHLALLPYTPTHIQGHRRR